MTPDDITRIAREADEYADSVFPSLPRPLGTHWSAVRDQRFAALVSAVEREVCLEIADQCADADMHASMAANAIRARSKP